MATMVEIATLLGAIAAIVSIALASYHVGTKMNELLNLINKLIEGHKDLHDDVRKIDEEVNGGVVNNREDCRLCEDEEE